MWRIMLLVAISEARSLSVSTSSDSINEHLVRTMVSYMDIEQQPCERFYEYACGNWERAQIDNGNFSYVDVIGSLEERANSELAALIEQRIASHQLETEPVYAKLRVYFETCIEHSYEAGEQLERYLELLKPAFNVQWPHEEGADISQFRWPHTLGRLRAIGLNNVLLNVELKHRNASAYILQLSRPNEAKFDLDEEESTEELTQLKRKLEQLWQSTVGQVTANEMTLGELQQRLPSLDMVDYLTQLQGASLPLNTPLLVRGLSYLRRLGELLAKTPAETLLHYLRIQLLNYLSEDQPASASPAHCVRHQRTLMPLALDYIYEQERYRYVRNETDAVVLQVFGRMQRKFREFIDQHASQLSESELDFLRVKIQRMRLSIGNLPQGVANSYYTNYYASLDVAPRYFHWNHLNALQHRVAREQQLLRLPPSAPEHSLFVWPYGAGSPAYNQATNRLLIPYAYLQLPIFHRQFHELFIYAELGNALGHEIMHGFDTVGLQYDASGSLSMIFMDAVHKKPHFLNALRCLNRETTSNLNEKLADFNGFRLAYESYFERQGAPVPELLIPNIGLTPKQLFFVKFAQFFCAVSPQRIDYDNSHDTPFSRVPQVLANHPAFAQEFNCALHTRMNLIPAERCNLW